jgi:class 3 adenylate cyclase
MSGVAIVVFSDLVDSTALLARLGDDRMDRVRRTHVEDVSREVAAGGGRVVKTLGDGVMASFESALGALQASAGIQAAVEQLDAVEGEIGIAARVGVSAGEPIADGEDLHGMAVVIASRLCSAAGTGEVLVQDVVGALVASREGIDLGEPTAYELKGVPGSVLASRLNRPALALADTSPNRVDTTADSPARSSSRLPPQLAAYAGEPLIGRDGQIATLREATVARAGRRAVLVLGEPGIGKTRHAAAVAAESHAQGAVVVLARCPADPVVPFEPWVRAIGELAIAADGQRREDLSRAAGPELSALVPELGEHGERVEESTAEETVLAEGGRFRLLRGINAVLARAAGESPLLVVLDDAHWCDPASAQALEHLLNGSASRLTLVVTARDSELGRWHPVSRVLSNLRRTDDLTELRLDGLDSAGLAELVGARTGRAITPRLAERLQARTAGNPFFAGELARDLEGRGALGGEDALDLAPVPDAVRGLVEERLARLDPTTERLLTAVAAIGPSAPIELAANATGLSTEDAARAVGEALSERLVDEVIAERPSVAFPHALIREALIAEADGPALARLHLAIAECLERDPAAEASELARHYGLSVGVGGTGRALAAYRAAASAAAAGHDHEGAAAHLQSALALLRTDDELLARGELLLELGEQRLLAGDLVRGRISFQGVIEVARSSGDAVMLARAALGFAGGDIGFGFESGIDDPACRPQLEEALDALGEDEPELALRALFRLAYISVYDRGEEFFAGTEARAAELAARIGGPDPRLLAEFTRLCGRFSHQPGDDPLVVLGFFDEMLGLRDLAEECEREDLRFRYVQWLAAAFYSKGRIGECDEAIEWAAEIATRIGSPRFTWEVDYSRAQRLLDRGERAAGEALLNRAGAALRRLRPDLQVLVQLSWGSLVGRVFDGDTAKIRSVFEANQTALPWGMAAAMSAWGAAVDGDLEIAGDRMWELLDDLEKLRGPDGHFSSGLFMLSEVAALAEDRAAAERLLPLMERLRGYLIVPAPAVGFGQLPEWHIGRLQLVLDRPERAAVELRETVARADSMGLAAFSAAARVTLALALDRCGQGAEAEQALEAGTRIVERYGVGSIEAAAVEARAVLEGVQPPVATAKAPARRRPLRGLAARGGRLALAKMAGGREDAELEKLFADPARQRALLRAMARGFQPGEAAGFRGTIAYELEPYAIERPPDAPWRWAIAVDAERGRAELIEPAPLDAAVTIRFGLADWVRVMAGLQEALPAIVAGRCTIEGDVALAARQEAMFGSG